MATESADVGWLQHIEFWHWWVLAVILLVLELTSPVFFFLWLGFAAAAVGFLLLVFPSIPIQAQLILFGLLSVVAVVAWQRYRRMRPPN
jgi:membrane protein implicated in regulation of membrane protease activity